VVFTLHSNIRTAALVLALIGLGALIVGRALGNEPGSLFEPGSRVSRSKLRQGPGRVSIFLLGTVLGLFLWQVEGAVVGDGLFHEGRVRKLVALGDLHLRTVDEFKDGGLHPGYAFPLWHGFLAL